MKSFQLSIFLILQFQSLIHKVRILSEYLIHIKKIFLYSHYQIPCLEIEMEVVKLSSIILDLTSMDFKSLVEQNVDKQPLKYVNRGTFNNCEEYLYSEKLTKAKRTHGIEYFDSFNTFSSQQMLQQALKSCSNFSFVWQRVRNTKDNFDKSMYQL